MMFSTNPFPHPTSTIQVFPPSNSFQDPQKHNFTTTSKQDLVEGLGLDRCDEYDHLFWSEVKNKKDHHSKIQTPQGPRDRRVRLSIDVAKKFFFLQDLLGVDKASETLDWLFKESKISIDELIRRKKQSSSSTVTDPSEDIFLETGSDEQTKGRKKKGGEEKRTKISRKYKSAGLNQSRAEARARARERTKEKLSFKKLGNKSKSVHVDCCSSNLTLQSSFWNLVGSQNGYDDKIGESVNEGDKISTLYSYKHNLAVSNASNASGSKFTGSGQPTSSTHAGSNKD